MVCWTASIAALLCSLLVLVQGDGHGVFCSTQFNSWFARVPSAEKTLLALAAPYNPSLTVCQMQSNANQLYAEFKARGGLGFPNPGGFDRTCTKVANPPGVPAGGCAFSYPVVTNSTCRLKILGPAVLHELQWCQTGLETSMRIGMGATGEESANMTDLICDQHTNFKIQGGPKEWESSNVLFNLLANTLVSICNTSSDGTAPSTAGFSGWDVFAISLSTAIAGAAIAVAVLCLWQRRRSNNTDPEVGAYSSLDVVLKTEHT